MPPREQTTTVGASGGYDHKLIAKAPEITKADRQEGYDINLVEQGRMSTRPQNAVPPATGSHSSLEKTAVIPPSASNGYSKSKYTPWYRTTKGLAAIIVVALVIVGVVVGVAVGVTQSKKSSNASGAALHPNESPNEVAPSNAASSNAAGGGATGVATTGVAPTAAPNVVPTTGILGNRPTNAVIPISD